MWALEHSKMDWRPPVNTLTILFLMIFPWLSCSACRHFKTTYMNDLTYFYFINVIELVLVIILLVYCAWDIPIVRPLFGDRNNNGSHSDCRFLF